MALKTVIRLAAAALALSLLAWGWGAVSVHLRRHRRLAEVSKLKAQAASPLAEDLVLAGKVRRNAEFLKGYHRVKGLLDRAAAEGLEVSALHPKLEKAARYAEQGKFQDAKMYLNIVELQIPVRRESLRVAGSQDAESPVPDFARGEETSPRGRTRR